MKLPSSPRDFDFYSRHIALPVDGEEKLELSAKRAKMKVSWKFCVCFSFSSSCCMWYRFFAIDVMNSWIFFLLLFHHRALFFFLFFSSARLLAPEFTFVRLSRRKEVLRCFTLQSVTIRRKKKANFYVLNLLVTSAGEASHPLFPFARCLCLSNIPPEYSNSRVHKFLWLDDVSMLSRRMRHQCQWGRNRRKINLSSESFDRKTSNVIGKGGKATTKGKARSMKMERKSFKVLAFCRAQLFELKLYISLPSDGSGGILWISHHASKQNKFFFLSWTCWADWRLTSRI